VLDIGSAKVDRCVISADQPSGQQGGVGFDTSGIRTRAIEITIIFTIHFGWKRICYIYNIFDRNLLITFAIFNRFLAIIFSDLPVWLSITDIAIHLTSSHPLPINMQQIYKRRNGAK
jgi:hypothetical protein